ncbi:hypothetical protein I5E68_15580 [Novosphingobium sp. YJ-S2-02]|uniref:Uncharacterized protein n=1 Tax=Novosphingobium aureum TaxID=2792964 RepID=A0A931HFF5_9SPHN|nr:hypothetical protein [Novosphingobium aureum]MBH0114366.1 hypothetical protein [Novosphingobium aureum]
MPYGEEKLGKATLRWQPDKKGGFVGVVNVGGKRETLIEDADEPRLIARLRNYAGRLHPDYFGYDGAIKRFRLFMPEGFASADNERSYKVKAADRLAGVLSINAALEANDTDAMKVAGASISTNMLSPFEAARLRDTLRGETGGRYLRGAAQFALGQYQDGIREMTAAVLPHGRISWPLITYLPFLWRYDEHMFLKPEVTKDFASRVGSSFCHRYSAEPDAQTYEALLELVAETKCEIRQLEPQDNIDIQSFIWVVGEYRDGELPQ